MPLVVVLVVIGRLDEVTLEKLYELKEEIDEGGRKNGSRGDRT
jgi:hypothetical protein